MGGVGGLLSIRDESGVYVPVYDGNGNVIALIDNGSGQQVASWTYGPFGESLGSTGRTDLCLMGFATHYTDEESGLVYFGHRYYAPETGRWLSHEPLGEMESWNLYAYCHNDPVNHVDVLGLAGVIVDSAESEESIYGIKTLRKLDEYLAVSSTFAGGGSVFRAALSDLARSRSNTK